MNAFANEIDRVERMTAPALAGRVADVTGLTVTVTGLPAPVGAMCGIQRADGVEVEAQVVGFRDDRTVLMPLRDMLGVARGDDVIARPGEARIGVCDEMLGRVINGMGRVIDDGPALYFDQYYPVYRSAPRALDRPLIREPLSTGIRSIDAMLTVGRGQRLGLFSGTGVGKRRAAGHDLAVHGCRCHYISTHGRAWSRGERVHRERYRLGRSQQDGHGGQHVGRVAGLAGACRLRRDRGGGVLPRSGQERSVADGFADADRDGAETDRPGRR